MILSKVLRIYVQHKVVSQEFAIMGFVHVKEVLLVIFVNNPLRLLLKSMV